MRRFVLLTLIGVGTACATLGGGAAGASLLLAFPASSAVAQSTAQQWPIKTREHVDLWLHGFALLQENDTTQVPLFHRGYRDEMTVRKNSANVLTQLDANLDGLRKRMRDIPGSVNVQFIPLYFGSVEEMRSVIDHFIAAKGMPDAATSPQDVAGFPVLATYFQTATERAWLSLFASSLWDESEKFYHAYWLQEQRTRVPVLDSVQYLWQTSVRPRLQRYLNNTQQPNGDIILSLPLGGGEGRTLSGRRPVIAVTFPERPSAARDAIYMLVHEVAAHVAGSAVNDHITPAQQRSGAGDQITALATVRGGLMLAERTLPELADGYARYYLGMAGKKPGANPRQELTALFPISDAIRDAMARQLQTVEGGI